MVYIQLFASYHHKIPSTPCWRSGKRASGYHFVVTGVTHADPSEVPHASRTVPKGAIGGQSLVSVAPRFEPRCDRFDSTISSNGFPSWTTEKTPGARVSSRAGRYLKEWPQSNAKFLTFGILDVLPVTCLSLDVFRLHLSQIDISEARVTLLRHYASCARADCSCRTFAEDLSAVTLHITSPTCHLRSLTTGDMQRQPSFPGALLAGATYLMDDYLTDPTRDLAEVRSKLDKNAIYSSIQQNQFLKDLGYDLRFLNWPQLYAIHDKATRDLAPIRSLWWFLLDRTVPLCNRARATSGPNPRHDLDRYCADSVADARAKIYACLKTISVVKSRAMYQISALKARITDHASATFEGDSMLLPGTRFSFNHNMEEFQDTTYWDLDDDSCPGEVTE